MGELEELASYCEDGVKTVDGMACRVFDGGKLLMPLAGACDTLGSIGFTQTTEDTGAAARTWRVTARS